MTAALSAMSASAQSRCDWVEYDNNPVFGQWLPGGAKAYYPKVLYDLGQFSGHGDSAYYKMWFGSSSGIGYAYSNDGISWTAGANQPTGLVTGANHPLVKYDPNGFSPGIYYKIWYEDMAYLWSIDALRYAESADGIIWTNDQALTQDGTYPLVTNSWPNWNTGSYGPCDLIYNQGGLNLPWNNKYVMYYMGTDGTKEAIGLAYSDNGTHWKRYIYGNGNDPVLSPGTADWDNTGVGYCSVINLSVNNWQMWYGGGPNTNNGIGYATSTDGINWTKHPDNPIFHISDNITWRNERTYTPWVVYDAAGFSGYGDACPYKMWFSGKSTTGEYSVGYACALPVVADAGPDRTIMPGGSTLIGGSPTASGGIPPYTYIWTPTTGLNDSTLANPTASPTTTTTYTITVTDSKDCTSSDNMTLYVQPAPTPSGGGGGGGLPASFYACPVTLAADIQGNIATVRMTKDGVLCKACLAKDAADKDTLELDKDTKVMLASNAIPLLLRLRESLAPPPAPENTAIVGPVYEISAYPTSYATIPSPITISPPATLTLTYDPKKLPNNATEVFIANYDTEQGWLALAPVPGVVAELGKVRGLASHFSPVAVLARLAEPTPAKFEVSNLTISPSQAQPTQEVTISIKVTNTGGKSGDYGLQLKIDGTIQSSKQVTVAAGSNKVVNFTATGYAAGKHKVEVAGLNGEFETTKVSQPTNTKWWFIGGVAAIILLIIVVLVAWKR
jgi:hypothetical protein